MSGGHFDYKQYEINIIADEIEHLIETNDSTELDDFGQHIGRHYPKEVIDRFSEAVVLLRKSIIYAQRIDWLVSGDDGEESFIRRLNAELGE